MCFGRHLQSMFSQVGKIQPQSFKSITEIQAKLDFEHGFSPSRFMGFDRSTRYFMAFTTIGDCGPEIIAQTKPLSIIY